MQFPWYTAVSFVHWTVFVDVSFEASTSTSPPSPRSPLSLPTVEGGAWRGEDEKTPPLVGSEGDVTEPSSTFPGGSWGASEEYEGEGFGIGCVVSAFGVAGWNVGVTDGCRFIQSFPLGCLGVVGIDGVEVGVCSVIAQSSSPVRGTVLTALDPTPRKKIGLHSKHTVSPNWSWKNPVGHSIQDAWPGTPLMDPGRQGVHSIDRG